MRANKKQAYLKRRAGVRKLRVHYRKTAPEEIDKTIFTFPKTSNISLIELRELHILQLCQKFSNIFSNTDIDIVTISALTIGGIYYLILHDKLSTFSGIDLKKESDRH